MNTCECGQRLDDLGLCPVCDDPALNPEPVPVETLDDCALDFWQDQSYREEA